MFGNFFKKKTRAAINEVGNAMLQYLLEYTKSYIGDLKKDSDSPFHLIDDEKLIHELMILSFWNLNLLNCPFNLWKAILDNYFQLLGIKDNEKQAIIKFMEVRSKSYNDSWKESNTDHDFLMFAAEVSKNIHESLFLDIRAHMSVSIFLKYLTEANAKMLKNINDKIILTQ